MKDAGRKGDLIWLNYEVQEFTNSFMYITHLTLISVQEGKFRKALIWAKVTKLGSKPSPSDPENVNNNLDIILWLNLPT